MSIMVKNVRCFFPTLDKAEKNPKFPDSPARYSIQVGIVPGSDNDKAIQAAIDLAGHDKYKAEWPEVKQEVQFSKQNYCYINGSKYKDKNGNVRDGYEGLIILRAGMTEDRGSPLVLSNKKDPATGRAAVISDPKEIKRQVYSGCYVNLKADIFAFGTSKGIGCGLLTVQFHADGAAFGGARPDDEGFDALDDTGDAGFDQDL